MKQVWVSASVAALLVMGLPAGAEAVHTPSVQAKKCATVTKIVHGQKHKVSVCLTNVSLKLATSRSKSAAMTVASGGTVTATASNGTKLTLNVPKNALTENATVTITPVASISGVTGKAIAAVQFKPDGLTLARPATLAISTKSSGSATGLAWLGSGQYAQRYPVKHTDGQVLITISHFSGIGTYDGDIGGLPAVRDAQISFYNQVLLPKLNAAQGSDAAFHDAIVLVETWIRGFELIGDPSFMQAERANVKKLLEQAFKSQINRAYVSCKTKHDVGKELRNLIAYARQAQGGVLLLLEDERAAKEIEDLANDRLEKCGTFRLDFETSLSGTNVFQGVDLVETWSLHVRVLGLRIQAVGSVEGTNPPPATKQLDYDSFEYTSTPLGDCQFAAVGVRLGGPFSVQRLDLSADDSSVTMDVSFGTPTEQVACGGTQADTTVYQTILRLLHQDESKGDVVHIAGWSILHGSVYARKTYSRTQSFPQGGVTYTPTERTTFDLKHAPE
jgi:hypothetical protein